MATAQPLEVSPLTMLGTGLFGSVDIRLGYRQLAGQVFSSIDGARLLLRANPYGDVYYVQVGEKGIIPLNKGKFFVQSYDAYRTDVNEGGFIYHVNMNLAGSKTVVSNFLDLFMGCVAVAGGPVGYAIAGMNIVVAGGKIKRNYTLYTEALEAFVSDDMELQRLMPTLYDYMYVGLFINRIEADLQGKAKDLVKGAIPAPKAVKALIGVFLGKVGEDPMKKMLSGIHKIIMEVLMLVIEHVEANKPALTADQVQQLAKYHIVVKFKDFFRLDVPQDKAEAIIRQTVNNGRQAKPRLLKIAKAIAALNG